MQQPHYEMANTLYQELTLDASCSSSTLSPNQSGHQNHLQHPRKCHEYPHFYQLCQHPNQFPAPQQEQSQYLEVLNCHRPQAESTTTVSFWKAFNTVVSDAKGKHQEVNENVGELEAVYTHARNKQRTDETGSVENTRAVANICLPVKNECQMLATDTVGVDGGVGTRRGRKRTRETKVEEEMGLVGAFLKRVVKRVIKHQEGLQSKILEVIERMDKEREEWEEGWRRREAIVKAREPRDLASRRDSSIV